MSAERFLRRHWQKKPLTLRGAMPSTPALVDADEIAWLATLDDVESRIVFTVRNDAGCRYTVEHGPFDAERLTALPDRDWTLLVNDIEKHLPELRSIVELVDFVPDWRIDDLMISIAAPGGGVGPHKDNYDVFLCQGRGVRRWIHTASDVPPDLDASKDLALLRPFQGEMFEARERDVLYLPPGIAHWGTAVDTCITYSIGMRAPRRSDLLRRQPDHNDAFLADSDLQSDEVRPGYISAQAISRCHALLRDDGIGRSDAALRLGCFVTEPKEWLRPEALPHMPRTSEELRMHGRARLAYDDGHVYLNGASRKIDATEKSMISDLCASREKMPVFGTEFRESALFDWLLRNAAFDFVAGDGQD